MILLAAVLVAVAVYVIHLVKSGEAAALVAPAHSHEVAGY
jgi:hypothetical protein